MRSLVFTSVFMLSTGLFAVSWEQGNFSVELTDFDGKPITNATVTVEATKGLLWGRGTSSDYNYTSADSDSEGTVSVDFKFCDPAFEWGLKTPSHYSQCFHPPREKFGCKVVESDYLHLDTNTVEGLARWNELKKLDEAGDENSLLEFAAKFEPKSVTYTEKSVRRSLRFYPKRNPQPMCAHDADSRIDMPGDEQKIVENGVEVTMYPVVEVDLQNHALLPSIYTKKAKGAVADMKIERYYVETNNIVTVYGRIVFAPGCGAYRRKQTGDESFPSTYEADTNAVFEQVFEFSSSRDKITRKRVAFRGVLGSDEYMVVRTRMSIAGDGSTNGWHYAKILGPIRMSSSLTWKESVFNPRFNDPNLEFDIEHNLTPGKNGSNDVRWP